MRHSAISRHHWLSGRMSAEFNVSCHGKVPVSRACGNPIKSGPIHVRLSTGDALAHHADLAIIGSGPKLLNRVELGSGETFAQLEYPGWMRSKYGGLLDGIRSSKFLAAPEFAWKHVVSIKARPSQRLRSRFQVEVSESVVVAVRHLVRPKSVLFVPYHQRPMEIVVLNTLCLIYLMMRAPYGKRTFFRPNDIEIVDLTDVKVFQEIFATVSANGAFTSFVKHQAEEYWSLYAKDVDSNPPEFEFECT